MIEGAAVSDLRLTRMHEKLRHHFRRSWEDARERFVTRGVVELTELDTQWLMANLVVRNGSSFRLPSLAARVASPAPGEIAAAARLCAGVAPAS